MLCEITVERVYLKVDLFNRQTAEETRDALVAIAAEARKARVLADSHIGSCLEAIFKVEQYGLPDYFKESAELR